MPFSLTQAIEVDVVAGIGTLNITNTVHETVTVRLLNPFDGFMGVGTDIQIVFLPGNVTQYEFIQTPQVFPSTATDARTPLAHDTDNALSLTIHSLDQYGNWNFYVT